MPRWPSRGTGGPNCAAISSEDVWKAPICIRALPVAQMRRRCASEEAPHKGAAFASATPHRSSIRTRAHLEHDIGCSVLDCDDKSYEREQASRRAARWPPSYAECRHVCVPSRATARCGFAHRQKIT